jgi:hypothetical protein
MKSYLGVVVALVLVAAVVVAPTPAFGTPTNPPRVHGFGASTNFGTVEDVKTPVVGMASTPSGNGYWLVDANGGVYSFGDARFHGGLGGVQLNAPIVGVAATRSGNGYWLVALDGGVFAFGDALFFGSMGGKPLNQPIVGMTRTASGAGYWFVASDGGVFAFGDASFFGSMGGQPLNEPVVGMASSPSSGYWLVARDGGIFAFGDAPFYGSMGGQALNKPIVQMASTKSGAGYWFVASDGGVFAFGDAAFHGSLGGTALPRPIVAIAAHPTGQGYWLVEGRYIPDALAGVAEISSARAGRESVAVYDNVSGETFVLDNGSHYCASIMKVNILGAAARDGLSEYERQQAIPMIRVSDNNAASQLYSSVGGPSAVRSWDRSVGMGVTEPGGSWGLTRTTASDQVQLMKQFAFPSSLSDGDRAFAIDQMHQVVASQRWGVTAGTNGAPVAVKNGWLPYNGSWVVNSIGWVHGNGHDYTIAVLTADAPSMGYAIQSIEEVSTRVYANLN